jgi:hypothetical protein
MRNERTRKSVPNGLSGSCPSQRRSIPNPNRRGALAVEKSGRRVGSIAPAVTKLKWPASRSVAAKPRKPVGPPVGVTGTFCSEK